ncbi:hypothetical protein ACTWPT_42705 [Nonomuraea sp. 3N208]|uniref:hypothetical protein n=1 Tax=Nonomuraea sp. 3N208 TaxID=3457421 RepID=UPI003FD0A73E
MNLSPDSLILDPFAGSGVIGTGCQSAHLRFFGIEAHPLVAELANLKLRPTPGPPTELRNEATRIADIVRTKAVATKRRIERLQSTETDLVVRSFTGPVLAELTALRDEIKQGSRVKWEPYLRWALLATLRDVAAVKVGWPYQRPAAARKPIHSDPISRFLVRVHWISEDIAIRSDADAGLSRVVAGDSRNPDAWSLEEQLGQGCISSPPYLNNFDYADATRLELYFWGYASSWAEMCATVRVDMVTATTQQSSAPAAQAAVQQLLQVGTFGDHLTPLIAALKDERAARPRGKEYDQVLPDYFAAMAQVLKNLAAAIEPDALSIWLIGDSAPYGVYVDTPALIGKLAEEYGFTVEKDVTMRKRGARWAQNQTRHNIELTERAMLFRRT